VFSIILKKIDDFLNLESVSFSSLNSDELKLRHVTLSVQSSSRFIDSIYDKDHD